MTHPLTTVVADHLRVIRDCRITHVSAEDTADGITDEVRASPEYLAAVTAGVVLRWLADDADGQAQRHHLLAEDPDSVPSLGAQMDALNEAVRAERLAANLRALANQVEQDAGGPPWTVDTLPTNPEEG